nr:MAG TPA: hypothetical protein [Caudoviricetes sp.]
MVWKTIISMSATHTGSLTMSVNDSKYLYAPYYFRLIDGQNNISYVNCNNIGTNYSNTYALKFQVYRVDDDNDWAEVNILKDHDINNYYLSLTGSYYVSLYIKEIAIGTLE